MNSELNKFQSALLSEDDVGKVIRTHVCIEFAVAKFLAAALCDSSHLKGANFDYYQKVHVALACGLRSDLKGLLKFIGTLRNRFAHNLNQRIDKQSMNNWYKEFSSELRESMRKVLRTSNVSWVVEGVQWQQVSPQDKFVSMAMSAYYETRIEVVRVASENKISELHGQIAKLVVKDA